MRHSHLPVAAILLAGWLLAAPTQAGPAQTAAEPSIEVAAFGVELGAAVNGDGTVSPLFAATDAAGLPEALGIQLAELLAEEVDFHRDLEQGYRCALVFEMRHPDGMPEPGRILAVEFVNADRRIEAFLFRGDAAYAGYYDALGVDMNKALRLVDPAHEPWSARLDRSDLSRAFRRSPLEFSRITSVPARLRYHPILKEWRAHRGTDYGASVGTRVLATAEGVVTFMGEKGSFGKLVELRHFDQYTTRYGHLKRFAHRLTLGQGVRKGQVIGLVGMTGLATGPHLHYELHADPGAGLPDKLVFAIKSLPPALRPLFERQVADYRDKLAFARNTPMIRLK